MSGGQQNKDEEIVKMVARMNELKEKQEPGSTKKEKDAKKDSKKKTPLSAEEQKEFAQLQQLGNTWQHVILKAKRHVEAENGRFLTAQGMTSRSTRPSCGRSSATAPWP